MSTSSTAAQADPSARVLAGPSAVQRARLGALVVFVAVGIVSSCLWAGCPVERISQYRRLERSFSHGYTTIPVPALLGSSDATCHRWVAGARLRTWPPARAPRWGAEACPPEPRPAAA